MLVRRIDAQCELQDLRASWNGLAGDIPFRRFEWLANWSRTLGSRSQLLALAVEDAAGAIIGVAPWCLETSGAAGRVVRFLGSGKACSEYASLLCQPGREAEVAAAIVGWLNENPLWDFVDLEATLATDPAVIALVEQLAAAGYPVHRQPGNACWQIELPASWDAYLASLSKSHRKQVRRVERRYLETGKATLHIATEETLGRGLKILVELHEKRWRRAGREGCFATIGFERFLAAAAEEMLPQQRAAIYWIEIDGVPATAEYHLLGGETQYAYQAGIDPDQLDHEPGRIFQAAVLRQAIESGVRRYDLLRGDESYKAHWRATPRETANWRIVARTAGARVRHQVLMAGAAMKELIKSGLAITGIRQ